MAGRVGAADQVQVQAQVHGTAEEEKHSTCCSSSKQHESLKPSISPILLMFDLHRMKRGSAICGCTNNKRIICRNIPTKEQTLACRTGTHRAVHVCYTLY
ncbi:hypothetical protein BS78_04G151000 [Paspalum vaginatum]|nr:hypothetical protein BS78_04G151000 [Paspalum vaginatum]